MLAASRRIVRLAGENAAAAHACPLIARGRQWRLVTTSGYAVMAWSTGQFETIRRPTVRLVACRKRYHFMLRCDAFSFTANV